MLASASAATLFRQLTGYLSAWNHSRSEGPVSFVGHGQPGWTWRRGGGFRQHMLFYLPASHHSRVQVLGGSLCKAKASPVGVLAGRWLPHGPSSRRRPAHPPRSQSHCDGGRGRRRGGPALIGRLPLLSAHRPTGGRWGARGALGLARAEFREGQSECREGPRRL